MSRARRPAARSHGRSPPLAPVTASLCQRWRPDSVHARRVCASRYTGTLAPSQIRSARNASRRNGGVATIATAAATPVDTSTTFAVVRAVALVIHQLRRGPPVVEPVEPVLPVPLPCVADDDGLLEVPRVKSELPV